MMKVKITSGIYGYRKPGAKRPDPKHAGDVIDLPDEEAMRLEQLKVGVILSAAEEHHCIYKCRCFPRVAFIDKN